jgi:hypothetical protein
MTCKVVRLIDRDRLVQLFISGHLQEVHINMIDDLLMKETDPVALDLGEVTLVDREVVRFLASLDARGVGLRNCPGFIREWMRRL